jgi:hygromycin-B 4-O-kinase
VDPRIYEYLYNEMIKFIPYCPNERWLVHGDFKGANIRFNGHTISGVLDWSESMYGDYLFDVAWIDLWDTYTDYQQAFFEHYRKQGRIPPFYYQRIRCYQLYSALLSLGFNATTGQHYKNERLHRLLLNHGLLGSNDRIYQLT